MGPDGPAGTGCAGSQILAPAGRAASGVVGACYSRSARDSPPSPMDAITLAISDRLGVLIRECNRCGLLVDRGCGLLVDRDGEGYFLFTKDGGEIPGYYIAISNLITAPDEEIESFVLRAFLESL